ncbi:hypothetical protein BJ684DRAFT_20428 [Piptocephalis cylindrospora]|uniref:Uncharacterized protein n=1 Tax=Piptocephalis cylindrospora TaxID=1907219 RepID=A0A4P9Y367_9FUNG|nr:hypothetical protein BJ684DRAFT_20428 [Piptocephalis cylindrospora]|eukprot:RKP13062.1 hypothetical protein BJ684DRAFT_20428 [Piptocephalis cylindrospora]
MSFIKQDPEQAAGDYTTSSSTSPHTTVESPESMGSSASGDFFTDLSASSALDPLFSTVDVDLSSLLPSLNFPSAPASSAPMHASASEPQDHFLSEMLQSNLFSLPSSTDGELAPEANTHLSPDRTPSPYTSPLSHGKRKYSTPSPFALLPTATTSSYPGPRTPAPPLTPEHVPVSPEGYKRPRPSPLDFGASAEASGNLGHHFASPFPTPGLVQNVPP